MGWFFGRLALYSIAISFIPLLLHSDPSLDAWRGAALLGRNKAKYDKCAITRKMYEEYGADYLVEHFASNVYVQPLAGEEEDDNDGDGDDDDEEEEQ